MKKSSAQGGFILKIAMFVVLVCVILIVLAVLAKSVGPSINNFTNNTETSIDTSKNNALLGFLNSPNSSSYSSGSSYSGNSENIPASVRSSYAGKISLGGGNAGSSIQPFEEYVTIRNSGSNPVTITGWTLTNNKGTKPIQNSGNNYFYPSASSATIGQGTEFLNPSGVFQTGPIVLQPGDNAIVTTGQSFSQFPFSITTSFRENMCDGYLKNYPFTPSLNQQCPYPTDDPDIRTVTDECYTYIQSLSRCEDPSKYDKTNYDLETSQCRAFMAARLNYPSCVANNLNNSNFSMNQWRVFLGKKQEMWASTRETITLYDSKGLIVDQISY